MPEKEQEKELVPVSRKKLLRFLRDQSKELEDFVKETDETRFKGAKPVEEEMIEEAQVEEEVIEEAQHMEIENISSDSDSNISEIEMEEADISGISELSE